MNKMDKLAREINDLKSQIRSMNSPQLAYSSIEDGALNEYDADGNLVSIIGKQVDGTHGLNVVAGPIPPAPADSGITVEGGSGVFKIKWNGTFENDNVAPLDFARIEVHVSDTPGFEFQPLPNSPTRAGSIESAGGGEVVMVRVTGTYYVKLLTRATTGKFSQPTAEFSVVVDPVVSAEELQGILDEVQQANADLAGLQITLGEVETDLANAQATLDTVDVIDGRLDNLELDVTTLSGEVANAEAAANNAVTEAQAAASTAGAAQAAADAAATAASNAAAEAGAATQAAQNAEAEALAAANLVAEKSTVYYGSTEPAGDPNGLWIKDGKPYLWNGSAWVESENADLVQAVADAQAAKTDAANAMSTANQAATDAANAQAAAAQAATDAAGALSAADTAVSAAQSAETAANAAALSADDALAASNAASAAAGAAQLAADAAETVAADADAAADAAVMQANDALVVAGEARTAGQNALSTANTAETKATSALTEAQEAASDALTAIGTANAATTAAQSAQEAADDANAEALAAAGLAGSKGEVIYQASAPTGSRAVSQNLWIRTTDNKPHTYDTVQAKWVAVTDKTATDAASAAATAQGRADSAWNLANTANGTANTALSTANGKNKVTYSPNAPGTAANTAGDIWFRRDANSVIIGQWEGLGGTSWAQRTIGNTVIANLDAGKITSGYIDAARINAGTITVGMIKPGDVATPGDVSTALVTAANDAQAKADAAADAAELAAKQYADGEIDASALAVANAAAQDAANKAATAKSEAISAAAADATSKANAAQTAAINAAALDAQNKANAAKTAAELAAKQYADGEIDAQALATAQAAAADAQAKATAAKDAAIAAAAADATSKANAAKTAAENAAKAYADTAISNRTNLVDNPSRTGAVGRWSGVGLTVVNRTIEGITTPVLEFPSTTSSIAYSGNGSDMFQIDPTKGYQISVWLEDEKALDAAGTSGSTQIYLGIHVYKENASTASAVTPVSTSGVESYPTTNFYFMNATATTAPIGGMRRYVGYLMPTGTDPANMKGLGVNVSSNAILGADARLGRIRVLNYNNQNTAGGRKVWIAHPSVVEVDAIALENAAKAAATADAASGTITLWKAPNSTLIDGGKIFTNSITANQIASGAITADEIAANAVTAAKINAGAVTAGKIDANAVTASTIAANAVTAGKINANAITAREIAANAVTASEIAANAVVAGKVAAGAVTAGTIAADAVAAGTVAADAITGREINALSINTGHLVSGAVVADKIAAGAIVADKLAANAVTADKIVGLTITGDKIAANAIGADKIVANSITGDKIAANTITAAEIKALTITSAEIATNAITAEKIQAGAITVGKLAAGTLSASNITAGYINSDIGIGTSGSLTVGETSGKHVLIGDGAITSLAPGATGMIPTITIGTSEDAFRLVDANGAYIGGIQADASVKATELDADVMRLDGEDLAERLNALPQGQLMYTNEYTNAVGPYSSKTGVYEFPIDVQAGRTYIIQTAFRGRQRGSRYFRYGLNYTFSTGSPSAPRIDSTQLSSTRIKDVPDSADSIYADVPDWFVYEPTQTGTARFLFWIDTGGTGTDGVEGRGFRFLVTDAGTSSENAGRPSLGGASGTTPVEPPPLKKYVKEYYLDTHKVWSQYGSGDTYAPQWVRSGNHSSFNSIYRTYLVLPSAARTALAGADSVSKIELRLSQTSGFSGRPWLGTITTTNITSSEPSIYNAAQSGTTINTGQTKWMTLSADQRNGLGPSGSSVGIVVGRKTAVTNQDFYGTSAGSSVRPKVRITYYA